MHSGHVARMHLTARAEKRGKQRARITVVTAVETCGEKNARVQETTSRARARSFPSPPTWAPGGARPLPQLATQPASQQFTFTRLCGSRIVHSTRSLLGLHIPRSSFAEQTTHGCSPRTRTERCTRRTMHCACPKPAAYCTSMLRPCIRIKVVVLPSIPGPR